MKKPFQVGDRVAVYGPGMLGGVASGDGKSQRRGAVIQVPNELNLYVHIVVRLDGGGDVAVHPKQCRRLVKRERRRITLYADSDGSAVWGKVVTAVGEFKPAERVEFVEVRRKS